jgi:1-acyl-sn-glycerol-3-phosphate acyltransferase
VLPVALRFVDGDGSQTEAPIYVGDMSLVESLWRIASTQSMAVELRFAPYVNADGHHRRELAQRVHGVIARELGLEPGHPPPERPAGRPAGPPSGIPVHGPHPAPADPR